MNETKRRKPAAKTEERRDSAWRRAAVAWLKADAAMKTAKDKILTLADGQSCYGAGVKHQRTACAGKVNYKDVPQLKGVDLDEYRGYIWFKTTISAI